MGTKTEKLDDIDFITDEINSIKRSSHKRDVQGKKIKVRSSLEVAQDDYKKAKQTHLKEIKRLKSQIKQHKLMMKQAKNTLKIIKLG